MDALDRQARTAGWLYLLLVLPGPFTLIYLPSKLIVRGDAAATVGGLGGHRVAQLIDSRRQPGAALGLRLCQLAVDLAQALCARMSLTCVPVMLDFDGLIPALRARKIEVLVIGFKSLKLGDVVYELNGKSIGSRTRSAVMSR